ncbi:MAG: hypothetical protein FVQ77_17040 [Cytophagales bacterium]|nr:hypothetical protein [Cytophagales bacterium]
MKRLFLLLFFSLSIYSCAPRCNTDSCKSGHFLKRHFGILTSMCKIKSCRARLMHYHPSKRRPQGQVFRGRTWLFSNQSPRVGEDLKDTKVKKK